MPDTNTTNGFPLPPAVPGGTELYDRLMAEIEPDLVTNAIPGLPEKYAAETKPERKARMQRYQKAFLEFDRRYDEFIQKQTDELRDWQKRLRAHIQQRAQEMDDTVLRDLSASIESA